MTDSGFVNLERVQMILHELGSVEDEIFRKRQQDELNFRYHTNCPNNNEFFFSLVSNCFRRQRQRNQKRRSGVSEANRPAYLPQGQFAPRAIGGGNNPIRNAHTEIQQSRIQALHYQQERAASSTTRNVEAAVALKAMLRSVRLCDY